MNALDDFFTTVTGFYPQSITLTSLCLRAGIELTQLRQENVDLLNDLTECRDNYKEMREEAKQSADENFRLVSEMEELAESIKALKLLLSKDGDYALCRADHKLMGLGEELMIGDVIERIDKALAAQSEKENKNDK
jgi:predicted nuclease with TOPRIM domain